MDVADALRIAAIFEADDIISVPAIACRTLANYVKELEERLSATQSAKFASQMELGEYVADSL